MSDEIVWYQPAYGSIYRPGQQINVVWKPLQSNCDASFRLCTSNALSSPSRRTEDPDHGRGKQVCGTATWPSITRLKNGTCAAKLDPPQVQKEQTYVLQLGNQSGPESESPYFTLAPSSGKLSAPADANEDSSDTPLSSETSQDNASKISSFVNDPNYQPFSTNTVTPHPHTNVALLSARDAASDSSTSTPSMLLSASTPNPLSFAIPLGFVLCIALVSVVLAVHYYRKRVQQRTTDAEKLATLSRFSSRDSISMYKDSLKYPADAALTTHVSGPVPLFMPVDLDALPAQEEARRTTRKSVPVSASYTNVSAPVRESTKVVKGSRPLIVSKESAEARDDGSREN